MYIGHVSQKFQNATRNAVKDIHAEKDRQEDYPLLYRFVAWLFGWK